jgi:DNA-binding transcriptional ArsR family regulator
LPKTRQGIVAATLVQPEKAWYVSELARRMGVPASSLQRELRDLSEVGILKTHRQGRMVYYQANTDSPVFPDLRGLLFKTAGIVDVLAQALKPLSARLRTAFVYGSIAAGGEQSDSDIDLMIVGQVSPKQVLSQPGRDQAFANASFSLHHEVDAPSRCGSLDLRGI